MEIGDFLPRRFRPKGKPGGAGRKGRKSLNEPPARVGGKKRLSVEEVDFLRKTADVNRKIGFMKEGGTEMKTFDLNHWIQQPFKAMPDPVILELTKSVESAWSKLGASVRNGNQNAIRLVDAYKKIWGKLRDEYSIRHPDANPLNF